MAVFKRTTRGRAGTPALRVEGRKSKRWYGKLRVGHRENRNMVLFPDKKP